MRRAVLAVCLSMLTILPAVGQQVRGRAVVLTSDSFMLGSRTFQLYGVDAIEFHQFCHVDGRPWACGASATRAFQTLLDPVVVTCDPNGESVGMAEFAICTSSEGDIAEIMVEQGWALANREQSDDYLAVEEVARRSGAGVWRGAVVEPWDFRQDIAAIESRYAERAIDSIGSDLSEALSTDSGFIDVFRDVVINEVVTTAGGVAGTEFEIRIERFDPGFILAAIEDRGVFDWAVPARSLEAWYQSAAARFVHEAIASVWLDLANRPSRIIETEGAETFYAAMKSVAEVWIAAERQPILLVAGLLTPSWIADWFGDAAPEGAEITFKDEPRGAEYVGTIDGVDVYAGPATVTESYLFPDDMLVEIAYRPGPGGNTVSVGLEEGPELTEFVFSFTRGVEWREDTIVWIRFPFEQPETPYNQGS